MLTKEQKKQYDANRYRESRQKLLEQTRQYYKKNKEKVDEYRKKWKREDRKKNLGKYRQKQREYRQKNKERVKQYKKRHYKRHKETILEKHKLWLVGNLEKVKQWRKKYQKTENCKMIDKKSKLKSKYGMTPEDYSLLLENQNGVCAICGKPETVIRRGKVQMLTVDHCHKTKKVRGLLCQKCNLAIGLLSESPEIINEILKYLKRE